jgi:hypothetical protein
VLQQARRVLSHRVRRGATMSSPQAVKDYLGVQIGMLEYEVFCVLFLDAQHRIIESKQMFRGTVTQTSVYPRDVVETALSRRAPLGCTSSYMPWPSEKLARAAPGGQAARRHSFSLRCPQVGSRDAPKCGPQLDPSCQRTAWDDCEPKSAVKCGF